MNLTEGQPFLQIPRVRQIRTTLRILWAAMVLSMGWVTFVLHHSLSTPPFQSQWLAGFGAVFALLSFVAPDWISRNLRPGAAQETLDTRLGMLLINHILRFALTEAALLFVLFTFVQSVNVVGCAYGVALGLMFFHFPTDARIASAGANF